MTETTSRNNATYPLETIHINIQEFRDVLEGIAATMHENGYLQGYTAGQSDHCQVMQTVLSDRIRPILSSFCKFLKENNVDARIKANIDALSCVIECIVLVPEPHYLSMLETVVNASLVIEKFLKDRKGLPVNYDFSMSVVPQKKSLDLHYICENFPIDVAF